MTTSILHAAPSSTDPFPADPFPADPFPADLSTERLEDELLGLAGNLAAAQCRFLRLLAEYDSRGGWSGPGLRSCAHWLCWRIGMSLRTATEHVRVAHALTDLPLITEAFAAGRISYSKVRAITRIAVQAPVGDRPADGGPDSGGPTDRDPTDGAPSSAADPDPDPSEVAHSQPPLAADAEQVLLDLALAGTASHVETVVRATRRARADPLRNAALRSLSWHYADDGSLILRGRFSPEEGALLVAAVESLVPPRAQVRHPVPAAPEGWRELGREQAPGAVADRVAARRADALLALVHGTTDEHPNYADASDGDTSGHTSGGAPGGWAAGGGPGAARAQAHIVVHVEASTGAARIEGGPDIPPATAERLACDADVQVLLRDSTTNRLYLGRRRRLASPAQVAALTVRDGAGCRFPGCTHTRHLRAHHVRHWFYGGPTDLDNLVLICGFHHGLVHEGGYGVRSEHGSWVFRRPDGEPVPIVGPPLDGNTESLLEIHTRAGLRITPTSLTPWWGGERLDTGSILDRLLPRQVPLAA